MVLYKGVENIIVALDQFMVYLHRLSKCILSGLVFV